MSAGRTIYTPYKDTKGRKILVVEHEDGFGYPLFQLAYNPGYKCAPKHYVCFGPTYKTMPEIRHAVDVEYGVVK
jgi:hypothetical protein